MKHEEVHESHAEASESEEMEESASLIQFTVHDFVKMKDELAEKQAARGEKTTEGKGKGKMKPAQRTVREEARVRTVQGNIFAQVALAFMNRSDHYHHAELFNIKAHQSWMPGHQGVSATNQSTKEKRNKHDN